MLFLISSLRVGSISTDLLQVCTVYRLVCACMYGTVRMSCELELVLWCGTQHLARRTYEYSSGIV